MTLTPQMVSEPERQTTDPVLLGVLKKGGIDSRYVEFVQDYTTREKGGNPYSKKYHDRKSGKSFQVISALPGVNAKGRRIEAGWLYAKGRYYSKANLFSAVIDSAAVTLTCLSDQPSGTLKGQQAKWSPQLFIGEGEVFPASEKAALLPVDPTNPNYRENVLEWDYGICKRRIRIIQGRFREWWIFDSNPGNKITIRHNLIGDLPIRLGKASGADFLTLACTVKGDSEIVYKSTLESAEYPVQIGASPETFYPDAHPESTSVDGEAFHNNAIGAGVSWATLITQAGQTADDTRTGYSLFLIRADSGVDKWRYTIRAFWLFDTSGLPDDCNITDAVLSVYGYGKLDTFGTSYDNAIYASNPDTNTAIITTDYANVSDVVFSDIINYNDWNVAGYNDFTLNAVGKAAISKTGISKFCGRCTKDATGVSPAWVSNAIQYCQLYFSEQGDGFKPKLVVTYIAGLTVTTQAASGVGEQGATANGNITAIGAQNADERGFDIGTATGVYTDEETEAGSFGVGAFDLELTGLDPATTYYIRAKAHDASGWVYGSEVEFTTTTHVVTFDPTEITRNSAMGEGYFGGDAPDQVGFEWGAATGVYTEDTLEAWESGHYFSVAMITGMDPDTTYYVRAMVNHPSLGWLYGNEIEFKTLPSFPAVSTNEPTGITETAFRANGEITDIGGENADSRGFVYGHTSQTDPGDVAPADAGYDEYVSEDGSYAAETFSWDLLELDSRTYYFYRAWAHNSYGYHYGGQIKVFVSNTINILYPQGYIESNIRFNTGYPPGTGKIFRLLDEDSVYVPPAGSYGFGGIAGNYIYEKLWYNDNYYRDVYTMSNPSERREGIIKLKWKARVLRNQYPYGKYKRAIKSGGTTYDGAILSGSSLAAYQDKCELFPTNPATGNAWTLSEVDLVGAGVTLGNSGGFGRIACDYLALHVLWVEAEVRTDYVDNYDGSSARLHGYVIEDEFEDCEIHFQWGLTDSYGETTTPQSKSKFNSFTAEISGLDSEETYHYRAVIETACGETFYGEDAIFPAASEIGVWLGDEDDWYKIEITDYVLGAVTEIGWDDELSEATAGMGTFTVDNHQGYFGPDNAGSPFYGYLYEGARVTFREIYSGIVYPIFTGRIDRINPHAEKDNMLCYIQVLDGMDDMAGAKISTALFTDTNAGELMAAILDEAAWPAGRRDIDTGIDDLTLGWFHKQFALGGIRALEKIEMGRAWIKPNGDFRFENRHARITGDGLVSQATFNDTMVEFTPEYSKRHVKNDIQITGRRYFAGGVQLFSGYDMATIDNDLIWSAHAGDSAAPYVPQDSTIVIWAEFNAPLSSYTALVRGTNWNANTEADGTGTDVSTSISVAEQQYGQAVRLTITNAGSVGAYLTPPSSPPSGAPEDRTLLIYGALYSVENITFVEEDTSSQETYGKRSLSIDTPFKANPYDLLAYAQYLKERHASPVPAIQATFDARTAWPDDTIYVHTLNLHISDRITASSTLLGIDGDFYINKVIHDYAFNEGGFVRKTTWTLEAAGGSAEGVYWILGVAGFGELGETTRLGF